MLTSFRPSVQLDMLALLLLPLLLATGGFALPSHRDASNIPVTALSLPVNQQQLVAPNYAPSFVTVAVGLQNYTCSEKGDWVWVVVAIVCSQ
jgi:hypothetical protein